MTQLVHSGVLSVCECILCHVCLQLMGLNGQPCVLQLGPGPVQPGSTLLLAGEGMPISKGGKGDLHVTVQVTIPRLPDDAKDKILPLLQGH
jgi:DnaJ-class molecular chaperone